MTRIVWNRCLFQLLFLFHFLSIGAYCRTCPICNPLGVNYIYTEDNINMKVKISFNRSVWLWYSKKESFVRLIVIIYKGGTWHKGKIQWAQYITIYFSFRMHWNPKWVRWIMKSVRGRDFVLGLTQAFFYYYCSCGLFIGPAVIFKILGLKALL